MYRTAPETRTVPGQQAGRTDTHRASARERPLNSTGRIGQRGPARLLYRTWAPYNLSLWCAVRTFTQQVRGSRLLALHPTLVQRHKVLAYKLTTLTSQLATLSASADLRSARRLPTSGR